MQGLRPGFSRDGFRIVLQGLNVFYAQIIREIITPIFGGDMVEAAIQNKAMNAI